MEGYVRRGGEVTSRERVGKLNFFTRAFYGDRDYHQAVVTGVARVYRTPTLTSGLTIAVLRLFEKYFVFGARSLGLSAKDIALILWSLVCAVNFSSYLNQKLSNDIESKAANKCVRKLLPDLLQWTFPCGLHSTNFQKHLAQKKRLFFIRSTE